MKKFVFMIAAASLVSGGASVALAQSTMTDANIVQIVKTADESEIDLAKVAKSQAENKDVKDFAKKMIDEHKKNEKESKDVAKKANVKLQETTESKAVEEQAKNTRIDLKKKKGADFDKAYIDQQISMHQQMLDDLNQKFIPAAQSPEVKTYLEATKAHVQEHLSRAQEIQSTLTK